MTERETSNTPAAELLARLVGTAQLAQPPRFYGGGLAVETHAEQLLATAVNEYLDRHPLERHRLADDLQPLLKVSSDYSHLVPPLRHIYRQGSHALETQVRSDWDYHRNIAACDFEQLESYRSDVASLARFAQRVDHATFYLCVAIDSQVSRSYWHKPGVVVRRPAKSLYGTLAKQCFSRWRSARELLVSDWSLPKAAEPLYRTAFWSLCELTPADTQLKSLFEHDRFRACRELVRHVDAYADQLALATDLAESLGEGDEAAAKAADKVRLHEIQEALLERAGERLTLTEAAQRLGISRQAVHKKIKNGSALGLMVGTTFVIPSTQFVQNESGTKVVSNLRDVLNLFTNAGAGAWSALQYLLDPDPALGGDVPLNLLKAGDSAQVVTMARAYLGQDEG
ncbi:hypothetical protein GCM10007880_65050 [Mesorhizobium amorphae]|uniref:HTH domain-containing protein n=1 Tax=Mesorhizobium amorphae TaxID=71433 RepID=UPI00235C3D62|nr:HTH domain-containing protein [Mesorhizobium amorphae]GLR45987.1 hypothetical protein GCM10007880_65050 [Mesorhizobium amorphae]